MEKGVTEEFEPTTLTDEEFLELLSDKVGLYLRRFTDEQLERLINDMKVKCCSHIEDAELLRILKADFEGHNCP